MSLFLRMTIRDSYPIPSRDKYIELLSDASIFSAMDPNTGYWHVKVAEQDPDKTCFTGHHCVFRFSRTPYGLKYGPGMFQRTMDVQLPKIQRKADLVCLDDIVIFRVHQTSMSIMSDKYCLFHMM